jgi:hypothetical protein
MTQTFYAHINKRKKFLERKKSLASGYMPAIPVAL